MFCSKCGSLLKIKKEKGKDIKYCDCGYSEEGNIELNDCKKEIEKGAEGIADEKSEPLPITDAKCDHCGNDKAYFWELQTRSADEPATEFYRCTKCGHTWRKY